MTAYPPKEWNGTNWQPVASVAQVLESDYREGRKRGKKNRELGGDLDGGAVTPANRTRDLDELEDVEVLESDDVQLSDGEVAPKRQCTQPPSQYPPL